MQITPWAKASGDRALGLQIMGTGNWEEWAGAGGGSEGLAQEAVSPVHAAKFSKRPKGAGRAARTASHSPAVAGQAEEPQKTADSRNSWHHL